jgi:hypothetical protein
LKYLMRGHAWSDIVPDASQGARIAASGRQAFGSKLITGNYSAWTPDAHVQEAWKVDHGFETASANNLQARAQTADPQNAALQQEDCGPGRLGRTTAVGTDWVSDQVCRKIQGPSGGLMIPRYTGIDSDGIAKTEADHFGNCPVCGALLNMAT